MAKTAPHRVRNVLIVGDFAEVNGGQAKVAIDSARLLAEQGVDVSFFAASGSPSPILNHPRIRKICLSQHTLIDNPSRLRAMASGLWNRAAARALEEEVARHDPTETVLHCHGWAKALSPSIGPVLARAPMPVLYTMHEYFLACPNGGFFDYRQNQICKRRPLSRDCLTTNCDARHAAHKVWRVGRTALARRLGKLPSALTDIAYISQTQLEAIHPYLPAKAQLHHLPNPVSQDGPLVDAGKNKDFIFVGRLSPEKGAAMFAEAAKRAGVRAVFVGDGPEADQIRRIDPSAEITGWVSPQEVQNRLASARAVVFPSLWYEGQPLVPIEALLRGIPVICGRWSAAHEVIEPGVNGILYDRPDCDALTAAIAKIDQIAAFDTDKLRREVSPAAHLRRLLSIYDGMLKRRASAVG